MKLNKDFYPTPDHVIKWMAEDLDLKNKTILDPSAGSGNILDYCAKHTDDLIAIEIEEAMCSILRDKGYRTFNRDFLTVSSNAFAALDIIIMNPPFSRDVDHILHAWEIAPDGCKVVALCNSETLRNPLYQKRQELLDLISNHGSYEELGNVFSDSDRPTDVEVSLIRLSKPDLEEMDYSMFFMEEEREEQGKEGIMTYKEVRAAVNNYVGCLKEFDVIEQSLEKINRMVDQAGVSKLTCSYGDKNGFVTKEDFAKELQRKSWRNMIHSFGLDRYFTTKVQQKLDKFISSQEQIPFTMKNIYIMLDSIFQTREQNLNEALVEAVDHFTKYTDRNRYSLPGWKTNLGHMLGKKFIVNGAISDYYIGIRYGSLAGDNLNDLLKVLCSVSGINYDHVMKPYDWVNRDMETNKWYDLCMIKEEEVGYKRKVIKGEPVLFRYKFYKKGTLHVEFTDLKAWEALNRRYAEIKGQSLPEKL